MTTPRAGSLGVLSSTGNIPFRDANGEIEEVDTSGANNGQVLTRVGGLPAWADSSAFLLLFQEFTPIDAVFGEINGQTGIARAGVRNKRSVLEFSDTAAAPADNENIAFMASLPTGFDFATNLLNVRIVWAAPAGILVGNVKWNVAWERLNSAGPDIDAAGGVFAAAKSVTDAAAAGTGQLVYTNIGFTQAEADGIFDADAYRIQVVRDANDAGDTLVGDASVLRVYVHETGAA